MADILSQEEIDALLEIVEDETDWKQELKNIVDNISSKEIQGTLEDPYIKLSISEAKQIVETISNVCSTSTSDFYIDTNDFKNKIKDNMKKMFETLIGLYDVEINEISIAENSKETFDFDIVYNHRDIALVKANKVFAAFIENFMLTTNKEFSSQNFVYDQCSFDSFIEFFKYVLQDFRSATSISLIFDVKYKDMFHDKLQIEFLG